MAFQVLIITQNEPFFIPKMIKYIIEHKDMVYSVKGITVLKPYRKNKNFLHWLKERTQVYSYYELFISGLSFIICKLSNILIKDSSYSVYSVINKNNLTSIITEDINSAEYIRKINSLGIDVIISISCPQLFKEELLSTAKIFCINAHGTLLPRHRGVFGSWWTLYSGDEVGGSTIHTMELKLDAGEILWQKEFPVEKNATQYSIAYKTKRDMSIGIVELLKKLSDGNVIPVQPKYETSYHRTPTEEQGKEFHKKGLRVIKSKDLKLILSKSF